MTNRIINGAFNSHGEHPTCKYIHARGHTTYIYISYIHWYWALRPFVTLQRRRFVQIDSPPSPFNYKSYGLIFCRRRRRCWQIALKTSSNSMRWTYEFIHFNGILNIWICIILCTMFVRLYRCADRIPCMWLKLISMILHKFNPNLICSP